MIVRGYICPFSVSYFILFDCTKYFGKYFRKANVFLRLGDDLPSDTKVIFLIQKEMLHSRIMKAFTLYKLIHISVTM